MENAIIIRYCEIHLKGKNRGFFEKLLKELEKTMRMESKAGHFERAAEARDQLFRLRELKRKIVFSDKEFFALTGPLFSPRDVNPRSSGRQRPVLGKTQKRHILAR